MEEFMKRKHEFMSNFCQSDDFYCYIDNKLSEDALTFLEFPKDMKATIQTTNALEGANSHIKRITKRKQLFPNSESAHRVITSAIIEYNNSVLSVCRGLKDYLK
jgi:transposase-like protein